MFSECDRISLTRQNLFKLPLVYPQKPIMMILTKRGKGERPSTDATPPTRKAKNYLSNRKWTRSDPKGL